MADSQVFMEMGFNIVYLTYMFCIVLYMIIKIKSVKSEQLPVAKRFLLGFVLLFVGDIAHVGLRLYLALTETIDNAGILEATGSILELCSMYCLMLCLIEAWATRFTKPRNIVYWVLMGGGVLGIILVLLPQNQWESTNPPAIWSAIHILPWVFQSLIGGILMIKDGKQAQDKMFKKIGTVLIPSTFCYSSPSLFPGLIPGMIIGLIMIIGTILYMIMEYAPVKEYFRKKE